MSPRVGVIVWTHRRPTVAIEAIECIRRQSHPVDATVVVDIASPVRDRAALAAQLGPDERLLVLDDNLGPGAAISAGLEALDLHALDHVWLVEDDSLPDSDCLAMLCDIAARQPGPAMVGPDGARVRFGRWHNQVRLPLGEHRRVDFVYLDDALIDAATLSRVGPPRSDYFLMMLDIEHPLRLADAGVGMFRRVLRTAPAG